MKNQINNTSSKKSGLFSESQLSILSCRTDSDSQFDAYNDERHSSVTGGLVKLLSFVFGCAILHSSPVAAAILTVNCAAGPFFNINAAVFAAVNGDTIMVEECAVPYAENVTISGFTGLHLAGVTPPAAGGDFGAKAAGAGAVVDSLTVVSGAGLGGACFDIQDSTDVKIQNFRLMACALAGVRIRSSKQVLILANRIINIPEASGIYAVNTDDLQITSNLVAYIGHDGILLEDTRFSTVADNLSFRTGLAGIRLTDGANNRIDNNDVRFAGIQGLIVSGTEARIERNSFTQSGAAVDIRVNPASVNADVVGNAVPLGIIDAGVGTDMANNF